MSRDSSFELASVKWFPNGFDSWVETHYEVSAEINWQFMKSDEDSIARLVREAHDAGGHGFLYALAMELTDEFESINKGRQWDGEYFDELENYLRFTLDKDLESSGHLKNMF